MSSDIIRIAPERIRFKLDDVADLQAPVWPGDWDVTRRLPLESSAKHRGIVQHFRDGVPWLETDLFREIFAVRFAQGEDVAGCRSIEKLGELYDIRYDGMYQHLKAHGFVPRIDGRPVKFPEVYLARDGEVILSNEGNHRVAMSKLLGLPFILAKVRTRHPEAPRPPFEVVTLHPVLPESAQSIPAMTTPAEQYAGYELAKAHAARGAIVELGVWLGAMTVHLAAGVRDAGAGRVHSYDRFDWKPVHTIKAGGPLKQPMLQQCKANLGELAAHVTFHVGDFRDATWKGPISLMILDGPKRVKELTLTLPIFGAALVPGARMAWQDFAHFASYDLPASLDTLERHGVVRWERGVYPGTMGIFEVCRPLTAEDVSADRLRLDRWTPEAIEATWDRWADRLPAGQRPRFHCGSALFLYDRGFPARGLARFRAILRDHREDVARKWQMIRETRPAFVQRYPDLDDAVGPV